MTRDADIYDLLSKWMDRTITVRESEALRSRLRLMTDEELAFFLSLLWEEKGREKAMANEDTLRLMLSEIRRKTRKERIVTMCRGWARAAAVLLIPLLSALSFYLYFNPVQDERVGMGDLVVRAEKGERSGITLPDGTKVKLNAESSLSYAPDFGEDIRQVNLKGEAYFEVERDESRPFVVRTGYLDVEVLGTCFNVYSYEEEDVMEMTLISGRIKIRRHAVPSDEIYLSPNEKALFDKRSGLLTVEKTDNRFETAWLRGDLVFRSARLLDVLAKIERKYGMNIHLGDSSIADDLFTGNFDGEYVVDAMELLRRHYGFTYEMQGDDIYIMP